MKYNYNNPVEYSKTENPIDPYKYPQTRVRYLSNIEFKQWLKGMKIE